MRRVLVNQSAWSLQKNELISCLMNGDYALVAVTGTSEEFYVVIWPLAFAI